RMCVTVLSIGSRMGGREKKLLAMRELGHQRVAQVLERDGVARDRRPGHSVRTDDEQRWLALGADEADRLRFAQDLGQPLKRELRAVGNLGPADEALQQADSRRQQLAVVGAAFL